LLWHATLNVINNAKHYWLYWYIHSNFDWWTNHWLLSTKHGNTWLQMNEAQHWLLLKKYNNTWLLWKKHNNMCLFFKEAQQYLTVMKEAKQHLTVMTSTHIIDCLKEQYWLLWMKQNNTDLWKLNMATLDCYERYAKTLTVIQIRYVGILYNVLLLLIYLSFKCVFYNKWVMSNCILNKDHHYKVEFLYFQTT
jgi:hypothetical protein